MATKVLKSLKGRTIRLTRLDECGVPVVGSCSSVVSHGFITVTYEDEYEGGEEYTVKNAYGELEVSEKEADQRKWVNVGISMCRVDPDILDIVADATPVVDDAGTGDTIGATFGTSKNASAFAVEVWTKQAGRDCSGGNPDWGYFVAPFVVNGKLDGGFTIENGALEFAMTGEGQPAVSDWGVNPYGDNPMLATGGFPTGETHGVVRTTVQPPAETSGCAAVS